jgi:hypothetical protein
MDFHSFPPDPYFRNDESPDSVPFYKRARSGVLDDRLQPTGLVHHGIYSMFKYGPQACSNLDGLDVV